MIEKARGTIPHALTVLAFLPRFFRTPSPFFLCVNDTSTAGSLKSRRSVPA